MKPIQSAIIAAAAIMGVTTAQATTATTVPVGYVTLDIPALADSTVTTPLSRSSVFAGVSTSVSGNQITVAATGAAASAWITPGDINSKCYVLIKTGSLAGLRFPVTANSATTISVNGGATSLEAQGFAAGDTLSVVPYWTLSTLFPAGVGVGVSQDIYDPQAYLIVSDQSSTGTNRGAAQLFFYADGTDGNAAGWRDLADPEGALQDTVALDPTITYTIRTGAAAQTLVVSGEVPTTTLATKVLTDSVSNDEYISSPHPVDITLAQSGLQSVIAASTDIYDPTEFVLVYSDESAGYNKGASSLYFYHDGSDGNTAGWKDLSDPEGANVTAPVIKAGRCFTLRKAAGVPGSSTWSAPLPYTL